MQFSRSPGSRKHELWHVTGLCLCGRLWYSPPACVSDFPTSNWLVFMPRISLLGNPLHAGCWLVVLLWGASCAWVSANARGQELSLSGTGDFDPYTGHSVESAIRRLQVLPDSLIYHPYLAGPKESRTGIQFFATEKDGWAWYSTVGGQFGVLRYGTYDDFKPVGIQFDVEGAAQYRSVDAELVDAGSTGVRFGLPVTIGWGTQETKLALYFYRAEPDLNFLIRRSEQSGWIFERRALVLGHSIHFADQLRFYGEVGYAFDSERCGEWEFQFGAEYAPVYPTRILGAPFAAANVYLLEADDFAGSVTLEAGWGWRGKTAQLLRFGVFYSYGRSTSLVLNDAKTENYGFGLWHDF
jgi:hypothetical protein